MKFKLLIAAAAVAFSANVATAATVSLSADQAISPVTAIPNQDFVPELNAAGVDTLFAENLSLILSGPANLTFSLVAAESGFQNTLLFDGTSVITETANGGSGTDFTTNVLQGQQFTTSFGGGDLASVLTFEALDFSGPATLSFTAADHEFGVFADAASIGALTTFYLALDDNGANIDDNHDDIIIRVDVAPIPLPAAAWMLLAGLGGLVGMRRFKRA